MLRTINAYDSDPNDAFSKDRAAEQNLIEMFLEDIKELFAEEKGRYLETNISTNLEKTDIAKIMLYHEKGDLNAVAFILSECAAQSFVSDIVELDLDGAIKIMKHLYKDKKNRVIVLEAFLNRIEEKYGSDALLVFGDNLKSDGQPSVQRDIKALLLERMRQEG